MTERARYRVREGFVLRVDDVTSARMARTRQGGTAPELVVRRALLALGLRYRLRNRDLPGSPDMANRSARWAVFVHGCFWHRHGCKATTTPARHREFWMAKFARNTARDARATAELRARGFVVAVVWECETKIEPARLAALLAERLLLVRDRRSRTPRAPSPGAGASRASASMVPAASMVPSASMVPAASSVRGRRRGTTVERAAGGHAAVERAAVGRAAVGYAAAERAAAERAAGRRR